MIYAESSNSRTSSNIPRFRCGTSSNDSAFKGSWSFFNIMRLLMRRFYNIPGFESSGKSWNFPGSGSAS
jgi:hypothetical protein